VALAAPEPPAPPLGGAPEEPVLLDELEEEPDGVLDPPLVDEPLLLLDEPLLLLDESLLLVDEPLLLVDEPLPVDELDEDPDDLLEE
jgi:hypothetical protein